MWLNKSHFVKVGITPIKASQFIKMLNRRMPSKTIEPEQRVKGKGYGKNPTKNFDLEYALKMTIEMEYKSNDKVLKDEWVELRETIELIKKEKVCTSLLVQ